MKAVSQAFTFIPREASEELEAVGLALELVQPIAARTITVATIPEERTTNVKPFVRRLQTSPKLARLIRIPHSSLSARIGPTPSSRPKSGSRQLPLGQDQSKIQRGVKP